MDIGEIEKIWEVEPIDLPIVEPDEEPVEEPVRESEPVEPEPVETL